MLTLAHMIMMSCRGPFSCPPPQNDTDHGTIREELDHLVASATVNDVNVEKVTQSVVVDAPSTSYY